MGRSRARSRYRKIRIADSFVFPSFEPAKKNPSSDTVNDFSNLVVPSIVFFRFFGLVNGLLFSK